jgi:hypothetical protein
MYLSNELYLGFVKLQADKGLGRSYAALLPFVEGLYHMGYITQDVYQAHAVRYSKPLLTVAAAEPKVLEFDKNLSFALKNWAEMPDKSRKYYLRKAKAHPESVVGQQILRKVASE